MVFVDLMLRALREVGTPLTISAAWNYIQQQGYYEGDAATPIATLGVSVSRYVAREDSEIEIVPNSYPAEYKLKQPMLGDNRWTSLDIARTILQEDRVLLTTQELWARAVERHYEQFWNHITETPEATIGAQMWREIQSRGELSEFIRFENFSPIRYGLRILLPEYPPVEPTIEEAQEIEEILEEQPEELIETSTVESNEPSTDEVSLHVQMIATTHLDAELLSCKSFLGRQERNRVIDFKHVDSDEFPAWFKDMAVRSHEIKRIEQIDNIWIWEKNGFEMPFLVIEHEKDNNLIAVFNRFARLARVLQQFPMRFESGPLYLIVAGSVDQVESYKRRIEGDVTFAEFSQAHEFSIIDFESVQNRKDGYLKILFKHLWKMIK